jgi:hypothetical protein
MTQDIIKLAREAGIYHAFDSEGHWDGLTDQKLFDPHPHPNDVVYGDKRTAEILERFAALVRADERDRATRENAYVLAERNKLASWMIAQGYATGHGETMEGLLEELEREVGFKRAELWLKRISDAVLAEREACAKVCDYMAARCIHDIRAAALMSAADNIRARGTE